RRMERASSTRMGSTTSPNCCPRSGSGATASFVPTPSHNWCRNSRREGPSASRTTWPSRAFFLRNSSSTSTSGTLERGAPMSNYEHELRQFIVQNFLYGQQDHQLANSDSFLELGIVDSTGIMELVSFLEQHYHIAIGDEEL